MSSCSDCSVSCPITDLSSSRTFGSRRDLSVSYPVISSLKPVAISAAARISAAALACAALACAAAKDIEACVVQGRPFGT